MSMDEWSEEFSYGFKAGEERGAADMRERAAKLAIQFLRQGNLGELPAAIRALPLDGGDGE